MLSSNSRMSARRVVISQICSSSPFRKFSVRPSSCAAARCRSGGDADGKEAFDEDAIE
jgi:hypothetical protein